MQIGINCLQIDPSSVGGVDTYAVGLLEAFAKVGNGHQFRVYATEGNQHLFESLRTRGHFDVVTFDTGVVSAKKRLCRAALLSWSEGFYEFTSNLLYRTIREEVSAQTDIFYTPTVALQWFNNRKPTVLSLHDILQVHHPEFFSWPRRLSRRITYGLSARRASYIQASSQFIKNDLLAYYDELSPEQVEVIYSGVNIEKFAAPGAPDVRERYGLPKRFLFFPAQLWPHKNHLTLLKALKQVEREHGLKIPLVLTGGKFPVTPKAIFEFIADQSMNYVQYLGKVPTPDMIALYHQAAFMITATLYESNSLPVLEAAAAGTPIIASRIPPLEELAQVLELNLFNPLDEAGLARLIVSLWNDEKTAEAQAAINRQQITCYSWEKTARGYLQFFERILSS